MDDHLIDPITLGRLLRAARIVAGCDSVSSAADLISERSGVHISDRTLYALERGEQSISAEQFFAILVGLRPPGGQRFFTEAIRPEVLEVLRSV